MTAPKGSLCWGRRCEAAQRGEFDASPESMTRLIRKLAAKHGKLHVPSAAA